jgi:4-carboxymuconolactone decarboxylase
VLLERRGCLGDEEYQDYVDCLGESVVFEISTLVGYYSLLALQLTLFRATVPRE